MIKCITCGRTKHDCQTPRGNWQPNERLCINVLSLVVLRFLSVVLFRRRCPFSQLQGCIDELLASTVDLDHKIEQFWYENRRERARESESERERERERERDDWGWKTAGDTKKRKAEGPL